MVCILENMTVMETTIKFSFDRAFLEEFTISMASKKMMIAFVICQRNFKLDFVRAVANIKSSIQRLKNGGISRFENLELSKNKK